MVKSPLKQERIITNPTFIYRSRIRIVWIYNDNNNNFQLRAGNILITIYVYIEKGGRIMWLLFGLIAIVATFINLYMYTTGKDYKLAMAMGLSFTALTLCSEYSFVSSWVQVEDWAALEDVVPGMERALWFLTIVSILLNVAPILLQLKNKK